jgi:hypothetical protein
MSWKTQARDSRGRFLPKVVEPVKNTPKTKRVSKQQTQVNVFVIDDSGSIKHNNMRQSIVSGMDQIIEDVQATNSNGKTTMWWGLSLFGSTNAKHYAFANTPLHLNNYDPCQSSTALHDGVAYAITQTELYLTKNKITTNNVVVTIFTDGQENDSRVYNPHTIKEFISKYTDKGWMINFVGAGSEKVVKEAASRMGIFEANTVAYSANAADTTKVLNKVSKGMKQYSKSVQQGQSSNIGFFAS